MLLNHFTLIFLWLAPSVQVRSYISGNGPNSCAPTVCHWWCHHPAGWGRHFRGSSCNSVSTSSWGQDQCGVCGKNIHDHLLMGEVSARWIPRLLTPLQKQERVECAKALLIMRQDNQDDFFDKLITPDETEVHHYNSETNIQSKQWKLL